MEAVHTRSLRRKAFIAEDNRDVLETLIKIIEHEGFTVVGTAATEYAAIDWLMHDQGGWDLAVIDLLLQDGSGFNVVRHFKASPHPGKIVVYSAFATDSVREKCIAFGADVVISKTDVLQLQQVLDAFRPRDGSHVE